MSFQRTPDGRLVSTRGTGGLVTALAGVLFEVDATWISAALTDGDREVAASKRSLEVEPVGHMGFLEVPGDRYDGYYNGISNHILWFLHHHLWDVATDPVFDGGTARAWEDYKEVNRAFAAALDAERDRNPVYLVQDYHLSLVPGYLREMQPRARIAHFSPHAVRRPRPSSGSCPTRCARRCCAACSAPTYSGSSPSSGRRTSCCARGTSRGRASIFGGGG
ncbi:MAG: hypothetical protein KatS3mg013_2001 [Actinomycetota bacterium]|nr:MAG: hypothetical protein KatS3mg013_2001 [Actinomycetota bacterium]